MHFLRSAALAALFLSLPAAAAHAGNSPQPLWQELQSAASDAGIAVTAAEQAEPGGLALSDLTFAGTAPLPEGNGTLEITLSLPEAYLKASADGRVALELPRETALTVRLANKTADWRSESSVTVKHGGSPVWISQDGGGLSWEVAGPSLLLKLAALQDWSEGVHSDYTDNLRFAYVKLSDFAYSGTTGSQANVAAGRLETKKLSYNLTLRDTEDGSEHGFQGSVEVFSATIQGEPGGGYSIALFADTSSGGVSETTAGEKAWFSVATGNTAFDFRAANERFKLSTEVKAASLAISPSGSKERYNAELLGGFSFGLALPLARIERPENFSIGLSFSGLTLDSRAWAQLDPQAWLPRDPAELALRMSGKGHISDDARESDFLKFSIDDEPLALNLTELDLSEFRLAAGGAALSGSANVIYEGSEAAPIPVGSAQLSVYGLHGFLDKLVKLGLLSDSDAVPLRFMLTAFTRPGGQPNTLVTDFEFQPGGAVLANGQRIK